MIEDLRSEAMTMQPRDFIMESLSSIRMVRAEAWKLYQSSQSEKDRRAYMQIILQTESQSTKLGTTIGLFGERDGNGPLAPGTYGEAGDDLSESLARDLASDAEEVLAMFADFGEMDDGELASVAGDPL